MCRLKQEAGETTEAALFHRHNERTAQWESCREHACATPSRRRGIKASAHFEIQKEREGMKTLCVYVLVRAVCVSFLDGLRDDPSIGVGEKKGTTGAITSFLSKSGALSGDF